MTEPSQTIERRGTADHPTAERAVVEPTLASWQSSPADPPRRLAASKVEASTSRRRWLTIAFVLLIALGLGSRRYGTALPTWLALYAGDVLWGTLYYVLFCWIAPRTKPLRAWLLAVATTELIEFSQLYRAPWIDAIRDTRVGGLLLGHAFVWSDVACVAVGATLGALADHLVGAWLGSRRARTP